MTKKLKDQAFRGRIPRAASVWAKLPNEPEKWFVFNEHSARGPMREAD